MGKYLAPLIISSSLLLAAFSPNSDKPPLTGNKEIDAITFSVYSQGKEDRFQGLRYFEFSVRPNLVITYYPYQIMDDHTQINFPFVKFEEYSNNSEGVYSLNRDCGRRLDPEFFKDGFIDSSEGCGELVERVYSILNSQ